MGWQQFLRTTSSFLLSISTIGYGAIAQAQWTEVDVFPTSTYSADPKLPQRLQPIPRQYIELGEQLEEMKYRWQSSQLTYQVQTETFTDNSDFEKSLGVNADQQVFLDKVQRKIDAYYHFLDVREFYWADSEAAEISHLIGNAYADNLPTEAAEIRAVWLDRGTIVEAGNEKNLAKVFDRFAQAGINVVFMETVNASYPIYPSNVAPAQNPALNGWDALASGIKLAHDRQMELHAWAWIFAAANQRHNEVMGQPRYYLGPVLSQNPTWGAGDRRGNPFQYRSHKAFFDPANPDVQQYLLDLLTEIATDYDVDGIQFDYIRYPFHEVTRNEVYGFGDASREQFRRLGYPDPTTLWIGDRHWQTWQEFRIAQVDNFVAKASQTLKRTNPELTLSAAVFAMPRTQRLEQIQQNWEAWVEAGHLDLLVPMTYAETTPELATLTDNLLASLPPGRTLLVPSIRLLDLDTGLALDQRQLLRQLPTVGSAFFAATDLERDFAKTLETGPTILPHRDPLGAIAQRFATLQQEWSASFTDTSWQTSANIFLQDLQRTQRDFNTKNLLLTQSYWDDFQVSFTPHLTTYAKQHPYQAQVWEHRLSVIDQLLDYSDRHNSLILQN